MINYIPVRWESSFIEWAVAQTTHAERAVFFRRI